MSSRTSINETLCINSSSTEFEDRKTYNLKYLYLCYQHVDVRVGETSGVLEKLTVTQLVKKFLAFYGNRRLITVFITFHHWSLS